MKTKNLIILLSLTTSGFTLFSGCGAIGTTGHSKNFKNGYSGYSAAGENPEYVCPSNPNLIPKFDYWLDGTFFFTACPHQSSQSKALVHGMTAGSDTIIVYPAYFQSTNNVYTFEDTNNPGNILSQQSQIGPYGVFVDFPIIPQNTVFNAMFVIEAQDKAQMDQCLAARDYFYCPNFAFGKFK